MDYANNGFTQGTNAQNTVKQVDEDREKKIKQYKITKMVRRHRKEKAKK